ncbi:MAG: hypothetical protein U0470_10865 [Anaerolineae bacterium]
MSRRTARDDAALAEAFRRLDAGEPRTPRSAETIQAAATATAASEAERIDAALRGLIQPTAAPDTLAGRVAADVARSRAAARRRGRWTGWAARRPAWATALAAAVVGALLGGAGLAAAGGGGTIGERARGVGEWVRDVLGVGVRGEGGGGVDDGEAYYWVPGMGILPLRSDAVVATGPVTATIGDRTVTIEGLVSDSGGTQLSISRTTARAGGMFGESRVFQAVAGDGKTLFRSCFLKFDPPDICALNPLSKDERQHGIARLYLPQVDGGVGVSVMPVPADGDYARFLRALRTIEVPVAAVSGGAFPRARRLGEDVERGGVRLRAWAVDPAPGRLAVRVETIGVAAGSDVRFLGLDGGTSDWKKDDPMSGVRLRLDSSPALRPARIWRHADMDDRIPRGLPVGWASTPRTAPEATTSGFTIISQTHYRLPMTFGFDVPARSTTQSTTVDVGPLILAVDDRLKGAQPPLDGPNSASVRVDTVAATYAVTKVLGAMGASGLPVERYPVKGTFHIADRTRRLGIGVVIDPGSPSPSITEPGRVAHAGQAMITVQWSDNGSDGRQLVQMEIGHVERSSFWRGLRRTCQGYAVGGGSGWAENGGSPEIWQAVGDSPDDVLPAVTLCLARPVFRIPGPWTFALEQP